MAYKLKLDINNLAETDLDGFSSVSPRWQELAEISASQSWIPGPRSGYTSQLVTGPEDHINTQRKSHGRQVQDDFSVVLGASRLRSRSRSRSRSRVHSRSHSKVRSSSNPPGRPLSIDKLRSSSPVLPSYQPMTPRRVRILALLALIGIVSSWFALFWFSSVDIFNLTKEPLWNDQRKSRNLGGSVKDALCQLPVFPRILACQTPSLETELLLRERSVRHAITGVLFALSESPDALDGVLDLLEKVEQGFRALQEEKPVQQTPLKQPVKPDHDSSTTQETEKEAKGAESATVTPDTDSSQHTSEPDSSLVGFEAWDILHTREETIKALIDHTAYLKGHIEKFDFGKEAILELTQQKFSHHNIWYKQIRNDGFQYNPKKWFVRHSTVQFRNIVEDDFKSQAMAFDRLKYGLENAGGNWSTLFEQTAILLASEHLSLDEEKDTPVRNSLLKRFILLTTPIHFSRPPRKSRRNHPHKNPTLKPLTPAQNRVQLLNAIQDIYPHLRALHTSTSKAYSSAKLAQWIVEAERLAWWKKEGERKLDKDIIRGMREAINMVNTLIAQRRQQRVTRVFEKGWTKREPGWREKYERLRAEREARRKEETERLEAFLEGLRTKYETKRAK